MDVTGEPKLSVRRRLALRSGNTCAFTGCSNRLEEAASDPGQGTVLAVECHIVAKRDHASIARAPMLLTEEEKWRWAGLVESRHGFDNLVLMCRIHAVLIDDPVQKFSVADIVDMKAAHEEAVDARRLEDTAAVEGEGGGAPPVPQARPVLLEDVGEWQKKSFRALLEADSQAASWLRSEIGSEDDSEKSSASWPRGPSS